MASGTVSTVWANQGSLEPIVQKLFHGEEILKNTRGDTKLVNPSSKQNLEIDVWVPSSSICFEFQDDYHYTTTWYSHIPLEDVQYKDDTKKGLVQRRGDTLVLVPFWWDGKEQSLIATVRFLRPDLLQGYATRSFAPINLNPLSPEYGFIPDVGQLMPASFPATPTFSSSLSLLNPWWMGEKYDGIRCCWHPILREVFTRSGRPLQLPQEFAPTFGPNFLDGEIWFGRGSFSESQVMLSGELESTDWCTVRLVVFDFPALEFQHLPFENRFSQLLNNTQPEHPIIITASRALCTSKERVLDSLYDVLEDSGEGLILRRPTSAYENVRSSELVKLKASRGDLEGLVTSVNSDHTISLQLPDGVSFKIPMQKVVPKKGDVVTFSYDSYTVKSVPLNPRNYRIRTDMTWEEAIHTFEQQITATTISNDASRVSSSSKKPHGFWQSEKGANLRKFFIDFAKEKGVDPLKASSWYNQSVKSFANFSGMSSVFHYFNGSYIKAITSVFPEIQFDTSKFLSVTQRYWMDVKNRRNFFDSFAKRNGFDPLNPEKWYRVSYQSILDCKGGNSLLAIFPNKSASRALMSVYPEIGFVRSKFSFVPRSYWEKSKNRRTYLEDFAKSKKFDPLVPENWYKISTAQLLVETNAHTVLSFNDGNLPASLSALFPEVKFDVAKFPPLPRIHLEIARHRKKFLKFAEKMGFNPLVTENWYPITRLQAISFPGIEHTLSCYGRSLHAALEAVFPELNFDRRKFANALKWHDVGNRRKFFDDFAASQGFDPLLPQNWYSVKRRSFTNEFSLGSVLTVYGGSLVKALLHNYPEIGFQDSKFPCLPKNHWDDPYNRKRFFDTFAKRKKFDPLIAKNWYKVNLNKIRMIKRSTTILAYTGGSIVKALASLYPNIGLQEDRFASLVTVPEGAKKFFDSYAKEQGFDPLVAANWYSAPLSTLLVRKKIASLNIPNKRSLVASLMSVYPNIGLVHNKFNLRRTITP
eukprot:Phypoly_transcript_01289.p1 GENE.Phypoly_transcript_01289~~Phypoly_transcript_01289.p1  ORF type:complete len:982 (+),score=115.84 Phypoly_transcript_01289:110-3055(+)